MNNTLAKVVTITTVTVTILLVLSFISRSGAEKILTNKGNVQIVNGRVYTNEEVEQMKAEQQAKAEDAAAKRDKDIADIRSMLTTNTISNEEKDFLATALCTINDLEGIVLANGRLSATFKEGTKGNQCSYSFKVVNGEMTNGKTESAHYFKSESTLKSAIAMLEDYKFVMNAESIKSVEKTSYGYKVESEGALGSREGTAVICIYVDEDNNITATEQEVTMHNKSVDSASSLVIRLEDLVLANS